MKARWHKAAASLPLGGSGIKERCVFPSLALHCSSASPKQRNTRELQSPSLLPPPVLKMIYLTTLSSAVLVLANKGICRLPPLLKSSNELLWQNFTDGGFYLFFSFKKLPFGHDTSNLTCNILFLCLVWTSSKDNEHYEIHSKCVRTVKFCLKQ